MIDYRLKRRWPRFKCIKPVNAKIYWAHNFLPFVSVKLLDISKKGIGFSSSRKLQSVSCELQIRSFPLLSGQVVYRREVNNKDDVTYQYGLILNRELNEVQLANLGCRGIISLEHVHTLLG